ncbi:MAG: PLP-dependent aminotransferase family protein [Anaerolineaceae bacterium]|nr:PLP-dependent aminotransferase family protein [Anaerolineaceae bacterium]
MRIPIDRENTTPIYRQVEQFIREGILSGSLAAEQRLPASRQLGADLGINRLTIEKAYGELEAKGLIYTRIGSGTFVSAQHYTEENTQSENGSISLPKWQDDLGQFMPLVLFKDEDELLLEMNHPDPISFSSGIGDANLFPVDEFRKVIHGVLKRDGMTALDYGDKEGYLPLRQMIVQILGSQGLHTKVEHVMITAGSQQAISLISQILLKPGDTVLVEKPTYSGALNLFRSIGVKIVSIPVDEKGMLVEQLEDTLRAHRPQLIYTIPNFQNPTGACMNGSRRRHLVALADQYNVPILEDDFVGDLRYDGFANPSLKALDSGGRVIYVSTFSKMLMPGLRMGYIVTEGPLFERLVEWKVVNDLATSSLLQRALESYVTVGRYQAHLRRATLMYGKRCEAMIKAIHNHLPVDIRFTRPQGGLFIWLQLPESIEAEELLAIACQQGVGFTVGNQFFVDPDEGRHCLRLNFVAQTPDRIELGIIRLSESIQQVLHQKNGSY